MSEGGFLENLYQGRYSKSLSFPYAGSPDEKKIHDFLSRFREAIAGYAPQ